MAILYFSSKKDVWFFLIIWGVIIFIILANLFDSEPIGLQHITNNIWEYIMGALIIGFLLWLWFGTGYKLEEGLIKIYFGPFRSKIMIQEIKSLRKTKNPLSAPALSINRLEILYGQYNVTMISPKNENAFIRLLLNENPDIKLDKTLFNLND